MIKLPTTLSHSFSLDALLELPVVNQINLPLIDANAHQWHDAESSFSSKTTIQPTYEYTNYAGDYQSNDTTVVAAKYGNTFMSLVGFDAARNQFDGGNAAGNDWSSNWYGYGNGNSGDAYLNLWSYDPWSGGAKQLLSAEVHINGNDVGNSGSFTGGDQTNSWNSGSGKHSLDWMMQTPNASATFHGDDGNAFKFSQVTWGDVTQISSDSGNSEHWSLELNGNLVALNQPVLPAHGEMNDLPWHEPVPTYFQDSF